MKYKKIVQKLVFLYIVAISLVAIVGMPTVFATTDNSVNIFLGVTPNLTYRNGTVEYTITVINYQFLPNPKDAYVDITFAPPKIDGAPDTDNLIPIATDQFIAVGDIIVYNKTTNPELEVILNLDPGVEVAYGKAFYHAEYVADPPYSADGSKDIPVEIIYPCIDIEKTVDFDGDTFFTNLETGPYNDTATWKINVSNCGDSLLTDVYVEDTNGMIWGPFSLSIGGYWETTYDEEHIVADKSNMATAQGLDLLGNLVGPVDDNAAVMVIGSNIAVEKSVKYNCNGPWNATGIIIDLAGPNAYDWCTFRINVTNIGDAPLNITIRDVLPDGLIHSNSSLPINPDYSNESTLIWYYDGVHREFLLPGKTILISFVAYMGECNIRYVNYVYVTSHYGSSPPITDIDTAYVEWTNCPTDDFLDINQSVFDRGCPIRHAEDGEWGAAQSFIPTQNTFTHAAIYVRTFSTPAFDLTVELRENHPQGTLIDTLIFTPVEVSDDWSWLQLDFLDVIVTPGLQYFIVCPPAPSGVTNNYGYEWGYALGNQYDDGAFWFTRDGGTLWHDLPDMYEFCFRTYGYL